MTLEEAREWWQRLEVMYPDVALKFDRVVRMIEHHAVQPTLIRGAIADAFGAGLGIDRATGEPYRDQKDSR